LAAYGVSVATGTAVALTYRGLVFWMPFIIGAILIHRTKSFRGKKNPDRLSPAKPKKRLMPANQPALLAQPASKQETAEQHGQSEGQPAQDQPAPDKKLSDRQRKLR
jgi:hypothetical protein